MIAALLIHFALRWWAYNRACNLLVGAWTMHDYEGSALSKSPHPLATLTIIKAPSLLVVLGSVGSIELTVRAEDETISGPKPHLGVVVFDPANKRTVTRILKYQDTDQVITQTVTVSDGGETLYVGATADGNKHALRKVPLPPGHILSPTIPRLPV